MALVIGMPLRQVLKILVTTVRRILKYLKPSPDAALSWELGDMEGKCPPDMLLSEPPEDPVWTVSKLPETTVNHTVAVSPQRWVGTEFIYFLDIPCETQSQRTICSIIITFLKNIMDRKIPPESLLSTNSYGEQVLSSDLLAGFVVPWAQQLRSWNATHDHDPQRGAHCRDTLKTLTTILDKADLLQHYRDDSGMACALFTMISSMESCIEAIWNVEHSAVLKGSRVCDTLNEKLIENWRLEGENFEMARLLTLGTTVPFSAYAISRPPTVNNASNMDTKDYTPKHVTSSCTCTFVKPPLSAVREVVQKDQVPVLVYNGTELLVRSACDVRYVAISHVWVDGLGSTTEEGLPRCQVQRLADLAGRLIPGGAFWQDGLCVPKQKKDRNHAIALMRKTYANAAKVLVLDEGLRTSCSVYTAKEECLLRIATSGWMQRIWTLQEGMLARELHIELKDGIIDCTHFNGFSFALAQKVFPLLKYRVSETPFAYKQHLDHAPRCTVNDMITLLRCRRTSKPEDEAVAISGLLAINTSELTTLETGEERMKNLFIQVRVLPRQLAVCGWYCDRLRIPNFGWAPTTLSKVVVPGDPDDPRKAICTEDGLFGEFTVIRFDPVTVPSRDWGISLNLKDTGSETEFFNVRLSQWSFLGSTRRGLTVDGFLMKGKCLEKSMRDEEVGAIQLLPELQQVPHPDDQRPTLACKFVAPASLYFGARNALPYWIRVDATVEPFRVVRVT